MFPKQPGFYFPTPNRLSRFKQSTNIRDSQRHNRLFFIDQNIPDYRQLIETTIDSIQCVIKHQALDNFLGLAAELEKLEVKLSTLPHFFAKPKAVLAESDNPDHLSSTV